MKIKKIEAFTLSEMIVVLILTTIVVGLSFSVLNVIEKHMIIIQNNYQGQTEVRTLENVLNLDFHKYSNVEYDNNMDKLLFSNEMDSIAYQFSKSTVVRGKDTFNVSLIEKFLFYKGSETPSGPIDALKGITSSEMGSKSFFIFKINDATHFIN